MPVLCTLSGVEIKPRRLLPAASASAARTHLLHAISLSIAAGEHIALVGPSGAGKSTLLAVLGGALEPDAGSLHLFGQRFWSLPARARQSLRRRLFIAPQAPPLPAFSRVVTTVMAARLPFMSLASLLLNLFRPRDPRAVWDALSAFDMQDKLYARVDSLSGGERQRVALARVFLTPAELLLCDEPLAALDPTLAHKVLEVLRSEASRRNAALVCSLHQIELARRHFSRIIGIREGKIMFDCASPSDEMIAALYAEAKSQAPSTANAAVPTPATRCSR